MTLAYTCYIVRIGALYVGFVFTLTRVPQPLSPLLSYHLIYVPGLLIPIPLRFRYENRWWRTATAMCMRALADSGLSTSGVYFDTFLWRERSHDHSERNSKY